MRTRILVGDIDVLASRWEARDRPMRPSPRPKLSLVVIDGPADPHVILLVHDLQVRIDATTRPPKK